MKKFLMLFMLVMLVSLNFQVASAAEDTDGDEPFIDIVLTEEEQEVLDALTLQVEQAKTIVVAIIASFMGTGVVALIVKFSLDRLLKLAKEKLVLAEATNVISTETAAAALVAIKIFQDEAQHQIDKLQETVTEFIQSNLQTTKSIEELIVEYNARDEALRELLEENIGTE